MRGRFEVIRHRAAGIAIAGSLVALLGSTAMADDAPKAPDAAAAIPMPTDPVALAAYNVLEKNCSRCHQEGKLVNRERPAKNFGNILKLDQIAANPTYVLPGNPMGSKLVRQITDKEMPYDVNYEGETKYGTVSEADLKALQDWITALGNRGASCEAHKFITPADMVGYMATDLDKQLAARRVTTRYLTLTHLANTCTDPDAMKVYRQGAIKFLNSLSRSADVVRLETIDPEGTILRLNLVDLGWSAADWDKLLTIYPYTVQPDTQLNSALTAGTQTALPYLRADWFTFTLSQPPIYNQVLLLPKTFQELTKSQNVDIEADIRNFVAQRAGFQKSGVSRNNRLIERHPSRSGYFWTSYDFGGNRDHQSLFEFPLGPGGDNGFHHDGGETIFSLPNGFQAYYLNKATGEQLDKGPTNIVQDPSRKDFAVSNGVSCMGCHDQGMRKAKDDIRESVLGTRSFPHDTRETVDGLYPTHDKMDSIIDADARRFADAMGRAGLDPTLKLNGVEMINALFKRYEDDLDMTLAASELGITVKAFKDAAPDADAKIKPLIRRLSQGAMPRDQFEIIVRDLAVQLTDLKAIQIAGAAGVGGAAGAGAAGTGGGSQAVPVALAQPIVTTDLSLTSDADSYHAGDKAVFTVVAPRDCFLTLNDIDERGAVVVLLPNKFLPDNHVKAGVPIQLPPPGAPFQYTLSDRGVETIAAVCSIKADGGDGIHHDFSKETFTSVPNYTAQLSRSIAITAVPTTSSPISGTTNTGAPAIAGSTPVSENTRSSFRAAIKLQVK